MPIPGICQPDLLPVTDTLRLRRFDAPTEEALRWYQDPELVLLVDGTRTPYDRATLRGMYGWLDARGELYWIEIQDDDSGPFRAVGDVTLMPEDLPIVLGDPAARGRGLGRQVLSALIQRAQSLGWDHLAVREIYDFNPHSEACFASAGFRKAGKTERGHAWRLDLADTDKGDVT